MTITTEADNDKRLILGVTCTWMRISLTIYNTPEHLFIVLYKYKTIFSPCGSTFSIICTLLENVSKSH